MLDRRTDFPDYDLSLLSLESFQRILCLAPHPDDEILGCGGLLALAHQKGACVRTIIVTSGQEGTDYAISLENQRLTESIKAAQALGLPHPSFWNFVDRQLRHTPPLIEKITQEICNFKPDLILLPALTEPHPDHQVLALSGQQAVRDSGISTDILFYEVGAPTQVNTLLDITEISTLKWKALEEFVSQEANHPYLKHAQAMSSVRSFGAGEKIKDAEAFWHIRSSEINNFSSSCWVSNRLLKGLVLDANELPLVSVIIRSMNRETLPQAISVISEQTYPNIEVIIVNATGSSHPTPSFPQHRFSLTLIASNGNLGQLGRSSAANEGINAATGRYAVFLDDDDLIYPSHIEKLVKSLQKNSSNVASYSGVRVEGSNGEYIREYDIDWHPLRLYGINFLPIHSILFDLNIVKKEKILFDPDLPVFEDWDFWCQLSEKGDFSHNPGITATYRQGLGTSKISDPQSDNFWRIWHKKVIEKHLHLFGIEKFIESLAWHSVNLDLQDCKNKNLSQKINHLNSNIEIIKSDHQKTLKSKSDLKVELENERFISKSLDIDLKKTLSELIITKQDLISKQEEIKNIAYEKNKIFADLELMNRSFDLLQSSIPVRLSKFIRNLFRFK